MNFLKQSTAVTIKVGPFVDDTDGKTAEESLTISQADIRLSKNGGDFAQSNDATGATHDENGYYNVPLDATDTGTVGRLRVAISESGALPVWQDFIVLPANVYDSIVSGSDYLDVNAYQLGGTQQTGNDVGADVNDILTDTAALPDSVLDAIVEGTYSVKEVLRIMAGVLAGKLSGGGTTTLTFRDLSDSLDRVTATVDSSGNRSAVTLDES